VPWVGPEVEPSPLLAECLPRGVAKEEDEEDEEAEDLADDATGTDKWSVLASVYESALDRLNATVWATAAGGELVTSGVAGGTLQAAGRRFAAVIQLLAGLSPEVRARLETGVGLQRWPSARQQELRSRCASLGLGRLSLGHGAGGCGGLGGGDGGGSGDFAAPGPLFGMSGDGTKVPMSELGANLTITGPASEAGF